MLSRLDSVKRLVRPGLIAVIRTDRPEQLPAIGEALLAGGINVLEITLTIPNPLAAIRLAQEQFADRALVGAGTVLEEKDCRAAIAAGARFIVSPICRTELVAVAHAAECLVMLGAYTPTEAQRAHEAGADFIKIFPADKLGPAYIRALRAPLPHLRLVPTGGVDLRTAEEFLQAGCAALGVGGSLLSAEILRTENWTELSRLARQFVGIANTFWAQAGKR
jgi:2-dehydro-3-deoxyphosphogluconate aldolase/(4S)-4-hydroxy-2-oxoglutarate aldolase